MPTNSTFYFAWAGAGEGFSGGHMREDELIFAFELRHEEGQFCELEIEIANPYVGLLAPGRPLWAWFSWSDGSGVYPLFYGRLVGIPDDMFADVVKLKLVAKPYNYADVQRALADSLKVLPFFDPVFVDDVKAKNPDAVLEGYSALWHCDRISHAVSISDIIAGEDGTVDFSQNEVFYDEVRMRLSGAPLLLCEIEAEVDWTQCDHTGVFEMKTVPDLVGDPKVGPGTKIKKGVDPPSSTPSQNQEKDPTQRTYSWEYKNISPGPHEDGDLMEESGSVTIPYYGGELTSQSKSEQNADPETGQGEEYSIKESYKDTEEIPPPPEAPDDPKPPSSPSGGGSAADAMKAKAEVAVEVEQDRKEAIYVAMRADVQPVLAQMTEDEKDLITSLSMNGQDVVAIGAASRADPVYFSTARGQQSVEYLLMVARAHLLAGARVVEVEWECPFTKIVYHALSCRMNATVADPRLPGGVVLGKIVNYGIRGDGDRGEFIGQVTINCAVGNGPAFGLLRDGRAVVDGRVVVDGGTPVYVEEGYVELGYQHYGGRMVNAVTNDMSFEELAFEQIGLQLPITADQILLRHEYHDGGPAQTIARGAATQSAAEGSRGGYDYIAPIGEMITEPPAEVHAISAREIAYHQAFTQATIQNPSWVEMEFAPVQKIATSVQYIAEISALTVPKQIDLAAPASP